MASGSGKDIYGHIDTEIADKLNSAVMGQLSGDGDEVDVHGVNDSRVKIPDMGVGKGKE